MSLRPEPLDHHGLVTLTSYREFLDFLTDKGRANSQSLNGRYPLPLLQEVQGLQALFATLSAVAPAPPDTSTEEWNPLSQRPHAPLLQSLGDELGADINALKSTIEQFTILSHEIMHIALWEPFFIGTWNPESQAEFASFSLLAEGYCHYFADIEVSRSIRVRLPDGEFALERQTPSNALFHPYRAFEALQIREPTQILGLYLEGFHGQVAGLCQGAQPWSTALAAQAFHFYQGSLDLLDDVYKVFKTLDIFSKFAKRFCAIPGLPSFLDASCTPKDSELKTYFLNFQAQALSQLAKKSSDELSLIALRRMLQMRAYYAWQVRWTIAHNLLLGEDLTAALKRSWLGELDRYLDGIEALLHSLARGTRFDLSNDLAALDRSYSLKVRKGLLKHKVWTAQRWLLAPKRAGGLLQVLTPKSPPTKLRKKLLETSQFFVEELSLQLETTPSLRERRKLLALISSVASLGSKAESSSKSTQLKAWQQLQAEASRPELRSLWSLPLASFHPEANSYRELLFSYQ